MHIVVVGAGEIGWHVADRLSREGHDVAVVEHDPVTIAALGEHLDVHAVQGSGTRPSVLGAAAIEKADMLVAVTDRDEVNLVASMLAKTSGVTTSVVRLEEPELRGPDGAALRSRVGADLVVDPDGETAEEIIQLVEYRGADEVYRMGGGDVVLLGADVREDSPLVGRTLMDIATSYEPHWDFLFGAITRGSETIIPRGDHRLEQGDHVRVLCRHDARGELLRLLGIAQGAARRVMVLGGGRIGSSVAARLERRGVEVVLIERDVPRAQELSVSLRRTTVVQGEITDPELLITEGIGRMDAVVAATGSDDANVLACAYAAREGAEWTIAVIHGLALLPLLRQLGIDAALSPRTASTNAVLRSVRGGFSAVTTFLESDAEVDEVEVRPGSPADGTIVAELHLPKQVLVGAVVRDGKSRIARGRTELRARDHVVLFAMPEALSRARELFGS